MRACASAVCDTSTGNELRVDKSSRLRDEQRLLLDARPVVCCPEAETNHAHYAPVSKCTHFTIYDP